MLSLGRICSALHLDRLPSSALGQPARAIGCEHKLGSLRRTQHCTSYVLVPHTRRNLAQDSCAAPPVTSSQSRLEAQAFALSQNLEAGNRNILKHAHHETQVFQAALLVVLQLVEAAQPVLKEAQR